MPKTQPPRVTASFKIMLDVGVDLGHLTLEEAIANARAMKVTDILDLKGLEYNDSDIKVTGVFAFEPLAAK